MSRVVAIIGVDTLRSAEIGQTKAAYLIRSAKTIHDFQKSVDRSGFGVYMHTKMTKELDLATMENCVCFNLRWVTRAVTQFFDAELRRHGILPTQTPILAALVAKSAWSMEELSDWLGMERTTLVRNLRPLERDGLLEITGAGRGGRVSISISAKGRKELEKATPAWRAAQQAVIKTLGRQRWSAILSDLDRAALALTR
jgi:DNA-binding MarR family transcriptional regulator